MERSHLPEDLIEEILSRVPAKSLARWRSASKGWNARLKSEIFAKMQSDNAPKEPSLIITLIDSRVYLVKPNLIHIHDKSAPSVTVTSPFYLTDPKHKSSQVDICSVFHCDGLFLCTTKKKRLVVWNPCSGETKWIEPRNRYHYKKSDCYALGYHNSSSKQYKILRVYRKGSDDNYCEIYDLATDSWREICTAPDGLTLFSGKRRGCVSMKGNTYWLVGFTRSSYILLLSFDFSTERFIRLFGTHRDPSCVENLSVVREDALCICFTSLTEVYIWGTKIRTGSVLPWKIFQANASSYADFDFSNGAILLAKEKDEGVLCFSNFIPRDPHGGNSTCKSSCPLLLNYLPSLTQIQQGTKTRDGTLNG